MPDFPPMTPQELDAVQYSSNPDDHRWLATVRDREARLRRAVILLSCLEHAPPGPGAVCNCDECVAIRQEREANADLPKG